MTHTIRPRARWRACPVAVLVDDEHVANTALDGSSTTRRKARDAAAMQKLQKLVAASLGLDAQRGDQLTVENIAFEAPVPEPVNGPSLWQRVSEQSGGAVRGVAVVLIVAMALLLVVRPVVGRLLTGRRQVVTAPGSAWPSSSRRRSPKSRARSRHNSTPCRARRTAASRC